MTSRVSRNMEPLQIDAASPRLKIKNRADIMAHITREIAPSVFYTTDELLAQLAEAPDNPAIGEGVALPYLTLPRIARPFTALFTFDEPVDFGAVDNRKVDILCLLLLPRKDGALNLYRLSRLSRLLRNPEFCAHLREARSENELLASFMSLEEKLLAA